MPKLSTQIKNSKFTDQAYIAHMQVHLDFIIEYREDMTCPMCTKYRLPKDLIYDKEEEEDEEYED